MISTVILNMRFQNLLLAGLINPETLCGWIPAASSSNAALADEVSIHNTYTFVLELHAHITCVVHHLV